MHYVRCVDKAVDAKIYSNMVLHHPSPTPLLRLCLLTCYPAAYNQSCLTAHTHSTAHYRRTYVRGTCTLQYVRTYVRTNRNTVVRVPVLLAPLKIISARTRAHSTLPSPLVATSVLYTYLHIRAGALLIPPL